MKAIAYSDFNQAIEIEDIPTPIPGAGEIQIQVVYAGVNPVDWKIRQGLLKNHIPHAFPLIPGWDAAGTISAIGEGVTEFKEGDEVYAYCRKPTIQWGTYAEYVCIEAQYAALKPQSLTFAQAATIPLVGLTSWQSLHDIGHLSASDTILIHAGAGGVGSLAIQLAKEAGAKVYTTASASNHTYVKKLGADVAIDYTKEDFVQSLKRYEPGGVDFVYDCVGGETLEKSYACVKKGGWLVSIVAPPDKEKAQELGIHVGYCFVRPNGEELRKLADLIDHGKIKAPEIQVFALQEASKAFEQSQGGHTRGKMALKI